MKKKKVDKRTILKKIGKIGLIVFNVLTGLWFFISLIAVIIASSTGAINTNSNNNSSHAVIFNENTRSNRPCIQLRDEVNSSGAYNDHSIGNDYSITGIENYNSNYILTCYDDIDYLRQYHLFMREEYLQDTLRTIALNVKSSFICTIPSTQYFTSHLNNNFSISGFHILYSSEVVNGVMNYYSSLRLYYLSNGAYASFPFCTYSCYYDNSLIFHESITYQDVNGDSARRKQDFDELFYGNKIFLLEQRSNSNDYGVFYFSDYSIHDIGVYFNFGSLTGNFSYLFPYTHYVDSNNVFEYTGDTSFLMSHEYQYIGGAFKIGTSSTIYNYLYIDFLKVSTYIFDLETRQLLYNATGTQNYIYVPYAIGLCNYNYYVNDLPSSQKIEVVRLCKTIGSATGYFLGIDKYDNISSLIILSIDGNYIPSYPRGLTIYSTLFFALKSQCAFVNGFYFYIDPSGNVHTGLTGAATGGDIDNSYIGDVFKLVNLILTSFTGLFGYYLLPGVSIGLLFALPLIFTIILFVVKLFKR